MLRFIAAAAAALSISVSSAIAGDFQGWSALAISGPVKEDSRFLVWFDGHARFGEDSSELRTSIIRPAVGYRVNDKLDVWLGYARVTSYFDGDGPNIGENRIWQQATYPVTEVFGGKLSGRSRLEQRFRNLDDFATPFFTPSDDDVGVRYRQFWRWARPIGETDFSWVVANETFIALNDADWGQKGGYDQNRAFFGAAYKLGDKMRLEGGYLNNHLNNGAGPNQMNHNLSVALFIGL